MTDYDVIVVGCGPTGLMACGELAKRGVRVLGIDKKPLLGINKRTVSGYCFLNQPFNNEIIRTEEEGGKTVLNYTNCNFSVEYDGIMQGIYNTYMFSDSGRYWKASTTKKPLYNLFNATKCLDVRYRWATRNGAEFLTETLAYKVSQTEKKVGVYVRTHGNDRIITCKKLIASDGLSSRIAKKTGANRTRHFFAKGPCIEYEMTGVACPYDRGDMLFFGNRNFGGMAGALIMVPSSVTDDAFRLETMSVLPATTSAQLVEYFIKKGPYAHWFANAEIVDISGALVELISPMIVPYQGNILFAGDSAAFAECLYQSATMEGYMSDVCTESELKGKRGFDDYTQFWADYFEWVRSPRRMADYLKRTMFPRFFSIKDIDFLFDLSQKYPLVTEEAEATPYDYTTVILQHFQSMPEVPDAMKHRMQEIIDADMSRIATVIGKTQKE